MNYLESIHFFESIKKLGSKPGLDNINNLLAKLDNPQDNLRVIHVAGTNGKGSVCTMINNILSEEGYIVGQFSSPHIVDYNEIIRINTKPICNDDFAKYTSVIKEKCNELVAENKHHPTLFECQTALALLYFSMMHVDYVVLEVGLGGRQDATNVIKQPLVSVITSISLDHTDYLGDTIDKIAYEKAGIIKDQCPIVLSPNPYEVLTTVKKCALEKNAPFYYDSYKDIELDIIKSTLDATTYSVVTPNYSYNQLELSLLGDYQLYNTSTVLLTMEVLRQQGISISNKSIYSGLKYVKWACRMELLPMEQMVLLDGAHNIEGTKALVRFIQNHLSNQPITLVFGVLEDKEYEEMVKLLFPLVDTVILTKPLNERALSLDALYAIGKKYCSNIDIKEAYRDAIDYGLETNNTVCCAGSLYLIGHIRKYLLNLS